MKKVFCIFALGIMGFSAHASAKTFLSPKIGGRNIDRCVNSYRFSEACSREATALAAHTFCRGHSGYNFKRAVQWQTRDGAWDDRTANVIWTEKMVNGKHTGNWLTHVGAFIFTAIECE